MRVKEELYKHNVAILKDYGGVRYKISVHSALRTKGVEKDKKDIKYSAKGTVHDQKLLSNLSRAKARVFEYACCNDWEYFITLTLDGNKYDREDLAKYKKDLGRWLDKYNRAHEVKIKYLLIPELHHDGKTWHMHGLIMGLPIEHLEAFNIERDHLPERLKGYYNWKAYQVKFGFCSLGLIQDKEKVASYIIKYVSKSILDCAAIGMNKKCYLNSQHLKIAKEIKRGYLCKPIVPDFENEYVMLQWFDDKVYDIESLQKKISTEPPSRNWGFQ